MIGDSAIRREFEEYAQRKYYMDYSFPFTTNADGSYYFGRIQGDLELWQASRVAPLATLEDECSAHMETLALLAKAENRVKELETALARADEYIERARLNLSYAKQDNVPSLEEAESNRNEAFHDYVAARAALASTQVGKGEET